jgi:ArsR family transcriptional regulator
VADDRDRPPPADLATPLQQLAELLQQLAEPVRLRILVTLMAHGELSVSALRDLFSLTQPAISHHLMLLRLSGLVQCCRAGKCNL